MKSCFVKYKEYVRKYREFYDEVKDTPQKEFLMIIGWLLGSAIKFGVYGNFVYVEDYTNFHNGVNKLLMYIAGLIQFEQKESLCEKKFRKFIWMNQESGIFMKL